MISKANDIKEFIEAVKGKVCLDVIYLAEQEATEAERLYYRSRSKGEGVLLESKEYADLLKGFISYLRYTVKPTDSADENVRLFRSLSENSG